MKHIAQRVGRLAPIPRSILPKRLRALENLTCVDALAFAIAEIIHASSIDSSSGKLRGRAREKASSVRWITNGSGCVRASTVR
jgi:hypothetical protein